MKLARGLAAALLLLACLGWASAGASLILPRFAAFLDCSFNLFSCRCAALSDCDPLDPRACYLPTPNDFWLRSNPAGQKRLAFSDNVWPKDDGGKPIKAAQGGWNDMDGWPALTPIMTYLPKLDLVRSAIPGHGNPASSLNRDARTFLIEADTGRKVAHWGELDFSSGGPDQYDQVFMMWPTRRLKDATRYIVAVRGLMDTDGGLIQPSPAFRALRDRRASTDPDVEERRAHFETIFRTLEAHGVVRNTVQLAWDFTTGSRESITGRLVHVRDDAWKQIKAASGGIRWQIRGVTENPSANIARQVEASLLAPQYVDKQEPGARLVLDAHGLPVFQKFAWFDFSIQIPKSLAENPRRPDASFLQYGHGLFGRRSEATSGYLQKMAQEQASVILSSDWIGLSNEDEIPTALMIADDLSNFGMLPDRSVQGMLQALMVTRVMREGAILKDPALMFNGQPMIQPEAPVYYYGNSQGGILGSVLVAVSQDVRRGCLGVGGASYAMLLPRSVDFSVLWEIMKFRYSDPIDRISLISLIQILWDRAEPGGFTHLMTDDTLPNTPTHEVLFQHALGDAQVTQLGTWIQGRTLDAQMFRSNVQEPGDVHFGFEMLEDNVIGRKALVQSYRYSIVPPIPVENVPPPKDNDPHGWVRKHPTAIEQMWRFFKTGQIVNTCGTACDNLDP